MPRPRLQFSIAALLIFVAVVAAICGWQVHSAAERRWQAARVIKIDALQAFAEGWLAEYQKTQALGIANAGGGESERVYFDGAQLCLANAELAFERGDKTTGIDQLKQAFRFACDCVQSLSVNMAGPERHLISRSDAWSLKLKITMMLAEQSPEAAEEVEAESVTMRYRGRHELSGALTEPATSDSPVGAATTASPFNSGPELPVKAQP